MPDAPRYTYSLGAQYRARKRILRPGRSDRFRTLPRLDEENLSTQKAYRTVNLRLGYEWDNWGFYLWGKNIFDEEYCTFVTPFEDTTICLDGEPRAVGATLT